MRAIAANAMSLYSKWSEDENKQCRAHKWIDKMAKQSDQRRWAYNIKIDAQIDKVQWAGKNRQQKSSHTVICAMNNAQLCWGCVHT